MDVVTNGMFDRNGFRISGMGTGYRQGMIKKHSGIFEGWSSEHTKDADEKEKVSQQVEEIDRHGQIVLLQPSSLILPLNCNP